MGSSKKRYNRQRQGKGRPTKSGETVRRDVPRKAHQTGATKASVGKLPFTRGTREIFSDACKRSRRRKAKKEEVIC